MRTQKGDYKRCSDIEGKLKEDGKFIFMKCANKQRAIAKGCLGIELNGYSLEIVGKFCYFGGTIGSRGVAVDIVIVKIKS